MKQLAIQVGLIVLLFGLGSCAAGFAATRVDIGPVVAATRDVAIIILAVISLLMAAAWGIVYFGAAWAVGRYGQKVLTAMRWVYGKTRRVEDGVLAGSERFVVRPLASTARTVTQATTLVSRSVAGPTAPSDLGHEVTGWRSYIRRRQGRAVVPLERERMEA
ncbi:MAG: hypothetical protein HY332_08345 [Chloroflexi bacterium]|nr:hypothetical protein [Chloroflexota bacterium]